MTKNKFCNKTSLRNESDVEQFFLINLLKDLGYKDVHVLTKHEIPKQSIGKATKKTHRPDYALKIGKTWVMVVEAKHPNKKIDDYIHEAQDYAMIYNRGFIGADPISYCLVSNGIKTKLVYPNQDKPILELNFSDFVEGNKNFEKLKKLISYSELRKDTSKEQEDVFEYRVPEIDELRGIFQTCHNLIWKKHKIAPKKAFYEFTKVLFVKLNEDKLIHEKINNKEKVEKKDFVFSLHWISQQQRTDNPINDILFVKYRDELEKQIEKKNKKRIFKKDEKINLSPSTIKEVVRYLENIDLRSVEEDLNGKTFETFLSAVIRGKALGQFFTPRTVIKFMVSLANIKIIYNQDEEAYRPEKVLDGCCGTGGFLIFALDELFKKVKNLKVSNKEEIKELIKNESLYGIDASEDDIVPIARMNMYLHGDGGTHIYLADTLDKELKIEKGLDPEIAEQKQELKTKINKGLKFDIILTNPPFSMNYSQKDPEQKDILKQYELAYPEGKENSTKIRSSLSSNIMFVERYWEFLKEGGKLITVIDESVLNADGQGDEYRRFREWLRKHYIIKAIISLPKNAFVNADTGVKTSVLYLVKRNQYVKEEQQEVFMAISKNIGHNDAGRPTPELNDLPQIFEDYQKFLKGKND